MKLLSKESTLLKASGNFFESLPPSLVSKAQLDLLINAADFFPPIIRFALECRLDHNEQVDLQFCMRRDEDDLDAIVDWFQNKFTDGEESERVIQFLKKWADESSMYHKSISEVFLEMDVLPSGIKTPLLFFELQPGLTDEQLKDFSCFILKDTLGENKSYFDLYKTIIDECPDPAFIAYLGILFSRDIDVLRVNIKKLPLTEVAPFLKRIGYAWNGPELDHWISFAYGYADRVTLCIDIGKEVFPKIGFECFWNEQPPTETYWRYFMEKLNTHNQYHQEKKEAVLNWDKDIFPGQINYWPEHLWLASLCKPENEFTFLKKWISHLKLSYSPGKGVDLKAYLAYESLWKQKKTLNNTFVNVNRPILEATLDIKHAIRKGVDYLLSSQQQSGWWKDYFVSPGSSDEWITAYVACHLARLKSPKTGTALDRAWEILKTRYRKNEGWAYNALITADADSTIWTWLFVNTAGFADKFPGSVFDMMKTYATPDGGITSYLLNGPTGKTNNKTDENYFNGWQIPHYCVTAAYALAGKQYAIDYLLDHQNPEGFWYSYWWTGPEYATALTIEALFKKDGEKYKEVILRSVNWACTKIREELDSQVPNDFKIALLLKIILCSPDPKLHLELSRSMVNYLLNAQNPEGGWNPSAEMRMPKPQETNHEKGGNILVVKDQNKNFTTVTILDALNKYDQANVF